MALVSTVGLGSGLDITSLVRQLVDAERAAPSAALNRREARTKSEISALGQVSSAFSQLQTALNRPLTLTWQGAAGPDTIDSASPASQVHPKTDDETSYRFLVLRTGAAGDSTVVGGVILEIEPQSGFAADVELLLRIACALRDGLMSEST